MKRVISSLGLTVLICGAQFASAQSTIRSLATERGRYVGSILNSEWFSGTAVSTYEPIHKAQFNVVVAENEMKFDALEPSQNTFNWTNADKLVAYAQANNMRIRGHALAWHSQVPAWVTNGSWTRATLLAVLKNHITSVVTRYKGKVQEWDVVNEAIDGAAWRTGSIWYSTIGADFIDSAFVWAHAADPSADLYYNDYSLEWGVGSGTKAGFLLAQCKKWKTNGIPITGVGSQTHIANTHTGTPANLKLLVDSLKSLGLTAAITELDIGFATGTTPTAADLAAQGHLYAQFMDLFLTSANMKTFIMWGFTDKYSWLSSQNKAYGLIYDASLVKKPAYDSLIAALNRHAPATVITPGTSSSATVASSSSVPTVVSSSSATLVSSSSNATSIHSNLGMGTSTTTEWTVYNMTGHMVARISATKDDLTSTWNRQSTNYPAGLYLVKSPFETRLLKVSKN